MESLNGPTTGERRVICYVGLVFIFGGVSLVGNDCFRVSCNTSNERIGTPERRLFRKLKPHKAGGSDGG